MPAEESTQQQTKGQDSGGNPDEDGVLALGCLVFHLGFLDLDRDQLFQVDLGKIVQLPRFAGQLDSQFVVFAVGKQREPGL